MSSPELQQLKQQTRQALAGEDWPQLQRLCQHWLSQYPGAADGHYVAGVLAGQGERFGLAAKAFERALQLDDRRADAAIQLARCLVRLGEHSRAHQLVQLAATDIREQAGLLDLAGSVLTHIGCHAEALGFYRKAVQLAPDRDLLLSNLSACALFNDERAEARHCLEQLLDRSPGQARAWWQYSRLSGPDPAVCSARLAAQLGQWQDSASLAYGHYALAKWQEDLGLWAAAADQYRLAAQHGKRQAPDYDPDREARTIDALITHFDQAWFRRLPEAGPVPAAGQCQPLFIVGLPRTGSTLLDAMLSAHSQISSAGELPFVGLLTKQLTGLPGREQLSPELAQAAGSVSPGSLAQAYWQATAYLGCPAGYRTDKLPGNFYYLGLLAKAFPAGRIVHVQRDPMDACFAIYKQLFAGAYPWSYDLDQLADYYLGYQRLMQHWRHLLGDRLIDVRYEDLVADPASQLPVLLDRLGLGMESGCLDFYRQGQTVATASAAQVREKPHTRSVGRWRHFDALMAPVQARLAAAGLL